MVATILSSPEAVKMSVFVVRAFVRMREQLTANAAILRRLAEIDRTLLLHDKDLSALWDRLQLLLEPPDDEAADETQNRDRLPRARESRALRSKTHRLKR